MSNVHPAYVAMRNASRHDRYQDYDKILTTGGTEEMCINIETMSNHSPRGTFKMIPNLTQRQIQLAMAAGIPLPKDSVLDAPSSVD
jgi:hypothetical protein